MLYRRARLGQFDVYDWQTGDTDSAPPVEGAPTPGGDSGAGVWSAISTRVGEFLDHFTRWTDEGRADVQQIGIELTDARSLLAGKLRAAYDAGQYETVDSLGAAIATIDTLLAEQDAISQKDAQYGSTWDTLASWVSAVKRAVGLGAVFVPIAISAALALAALSALAWVISSWSSLRTRAAVVKDLANRLASKELTSAEVKTLADTMNSQAGGFGGWFSGLGTTGLLVLAGAAFFFLGGFRRA